MSTSNYADYCRAKSTCQYRQSSSCLIQRRPCHSIWPSYQKKRQRLCSSIKEKIVQLVRGCQCNIFACFVENTFARIVKMSIVQNNITRLWFVSKLALWESSATEKDIMHAKIFMKMTLEFLFMRSLTIHKEWIIKMNTIWMR